MKKSILGMTAMAVVLFGMNACAGKTNVATEDGAEDNMVVAEVANDTETLAAEEEIGLQQVKAEQQEKAEDAENADAFKTTPSGLKYRVLKEGTGKKPSATDVVTVHYEGKLLDGTVFDSSYQRGEPTSFPLNRVIAGWTEGLQLMPEGSIYELYIPYQLAYGEMGTPGGPIPPKADLIFKVELLKVE